MAKKAKNNVVLTLEEKPYPVPGNWCWTKIGSILSVSSGTGLTAKKMNLNGGIPVYGGNGITGYHDNNTVDGITVVIGRVGAHCGCVHYIEGKAWVTDNALIVSYNQNLFNERFIYCLRKYTKLRENDSSSA